MSEQSCRHMNERVPTGACVVCQPAMFPSPERRAATEAWFEARRERYVPTDPPAAPRQRAVKPLFKPGAPQQREEVAERPARPATAEQPAAAAPPPSLTAPAPWQELTQQELAVLDTLVALAREPDFDGVTFGQLILMFVQSAAEVGLRSWTVEELAEALAGLQRRAYAGPYDSGEWAASGKGTAVLDDYKRRFARVS